MLDKPTNQPTTRGKSNGCLFLSRGEEVAREVSGWKGRTKAVMDWIMGEEGGFDVYWGNYIEMEREYRRYMVVNGKQASRLERPVLISTTGFRPSIGSASY